jgi:hypothetical protein
MRGRIFATQVVSANFVSLLPLLVVGAVTDFAGVTAVLLGISVFLLLFAYASVRVGGLTDDEETSERPPDGVSSSVDTPSRLG